MKKVIMFGMLVLFVSIFFVSAGLEQKSLEKIDPNIIKSFNSGEEKVEVIIELNNNTIPKRNFLINIFSKPKKNVSEILENKIQHQSKNSIMLELTNNDLKNIENNPQIKKIIKLEKIHAFLGDSISIINATKAWNLQLLLPAINLTGLHQSVCIIDTGINMSHPDLNSSYLGGYDFVNSDTNPSDDNGHGTHVAGIVGANGGIKGIAPGVGIVAIKVLDDSGSGSVSDLIFAIDWCINNASQFNITTISMSLGCNATIDGYTSSCDTINDGCGNILLTDSINTAVANNISVLAATGNYGNSTAISSPACIINTTPISSTTKLDAISSFSDRNSLVRLFAPGTNINSTRWNPSGDNANCVESGNYMVCSGTSMATPMVAGVIAIINQYLSLTGQTMTPSEIEDTLYNTGLQFNESSNNFSRINVYSALLSLDTDAPNVTLVSPTNNKVNISTNQTFTCNATDWQLSNMTLKIWNSSVLYYNATNNLTGIANQTSFDVTNMSEQTYKWNCLAMDNQSNSNYSSLNFTLTIGGISTTLLSPTTNNYTKINDTNFSCEVYSEANSELTNITFYLWNSSGNLNYSLTEDITEFYNLTTFNFTFINEGNYSWNCLSINNASNESLGANNFSIVYDITNPIISGVSVSGISTSGATIAWATVNETTNSSISVSGGSWNNSLNYTTSHLITISGLSASTTYNYNVTSCDQAKNCNSSTGHSFTTSTSGGNNNNGGSNSVSSNGASISLPQTYEATSSEVSAGYTKKLKKDEKINFSIFDFEGGRHLLTVNEVSTDYVNITIESDPINLKLGIGQSIKLNLTSKNYYDLFIKLNNITDSIAELTIQLINEPIKPKTTEIIVEEVVKTEILKGKDYLWVVITLIIILASIVFVVIKLNSKKLKTKKPLKKKHGKNKKIKT